MNTRPLTKADYDEIVREIDHWWGGPTTALAHPMFFYELGNLARVVENEGQLVGFLFGFLCPDKSTGYVHLVGIHPDYRRRGVARMLYTAFEEDCRREGMNLLKAITTLGNEASVSFHRALGWNAAEIEDYAGPGRMRIVFTKSLTPG
ncbi:MAG: GNAT family N-acetyltransferase [Polyangiaceae bacterium]|nr:GNAT family N-acetyltransferase [Polyangiaceae bacterium]